MTYGRQEVEESWYTRIRYRYHFLNRERRKGAVHRRERTTLFPKTGCSFLMNSFRFPCLNVGTARARAQHVGQSRKMFVILFFSSAYISTKHEHVHASQDLLIQIGRQLQKSRPGVRLFLQFGIEQAILVDLPNRIKSRQTKKSCLLLIRTAGLRFALFGVQSPSLSYAPPSSWKSTGTLFSCSSVWPWRKANKVSSQDFRHVSNAD